jgi:hypothetical protein
MVDLIHETDDAMAEAELLLERSRAITLNGRDKRGRALVRIVGKYFPGKLSSASLVRSPQFRCFCRRKSDPVSFVAAARALGGRAEAALRGYVRRRVLPEIGEREFVVVYVHSLVDRGDNFPGVAAIRAAYEALPAAAKERLRAVYFVHPGFQARLFFATLGRFLFSSPGMYIQRITPCVLHYDSWVRRWCLPWFPWNFGSCRLYEKLRYMSRLEYLWEHVSKGEMEVPECARRHDEELERRPLMDYGIEATDRRCMFDAASMDTSASLHSLRCIS